jgi:hypothetical protein
MFSAYVSRNTETPPFGVGCMITAAGLRPGSSPTTSDRPGRGAMRPLTCHSSSKVWPKTACPDTSRPNLEWTWTSTQSLDCPMIRLS